MNLATAAHAYRVGQQNDKAAELAPQCLNLEEGNLAALFLLAHVYTASEQWTELATVADQLSRVCHHAENRQRYARHAATLWADQVGDTARAINSIQHALKQDPTDPAAFALAERLLRDEEQFAELARLFSERIKATRQLADRIHLLKAQAHLYRDHVHDHGEAIAVLHELLLLVPNDVETMADLAEVLCLEKRWTEAADVLVSLVARSTHKETRRLARLRLAEIWLAHLHNPTQARQILQTALDHHPDDVQAKRYLVDVAMATGDWSTARRLLEEVAADEDPGTQVWALTKLALVANLGLRDQELRRQCELEAFGIATNEATLLTDLVTAYRDRNEQERFLSLGREILLNKPQVQETFHLRLALARVLLDDQSQPDRALEYLEPVLKVQPDHGEVRLLHAHALEQRHESEAAATTYRRLIQHHPSRVEPYEGLARLMGDLGAPEIATAAAAIVDILTQPSQALPPIPSGGGPGLTTGSA